MNDLIFTLKTGNTDTPIQSTYLERIDNFKADELENKKIVSNRVKEMFKMRTTILEQLNKELGADVWFVRERDENRYSTNYRFLSNPNKFFGVSIGFRDGIYRNTPYNDWDLIIATPWKREKTLGNLAYTEPNLDVLEIYLVRSNYNNTKNLKEVVHKITDLNQVHQFLENDYLTYFIEKDKEKTK